MARVRSGCRMSPLVSDVFLLREPPPELAVERDRLVAIVRSVAPEAEVLEVGSTSAEGVIGKQDLDLLARVSLQDFVETRARLDMMFLRDVQQLSDGEYQAYRLPGPLDAALQLTVSGCQYDLLLDVLREDSALIRAYNDLKRRWHGRSMHEYRVEKAAFIKSVLDSAASRAGR